MADRLEILRFGPTKTHRIIEIGPCHNPIFPKRDGWSAHSIDHTNQAGLREKYRGDPSVNPDLIEAVDFVWTEGSLSTAVPPDQHGTFDVFVASHVIEHTPDLVAFLSAAEALVKLDGRVVLAIPDKRVCFDYYRPISTIGDVVEASHQNRTRHSKKTLWDHFFHLAVKNGQPGWVRTNQDQLELIFQFGNAADFGKKSESEGYVDAHNWVFVPASFELIIFCLARLGLTDWQIERSEIAEGTEFFVWLKRGGKAAISSKTEEEFSQLRHRLLEMMMLQLDEQSRQIPMSIGVSAERLLQAEKSEGRVAQLQADLDAANELVVAMRATHAWKARTRLRRAVGLAPTIADR
jgi:hypothetical protein